MKRALPLAVAWLLAIAPMAQQDQKQASWLRRTIATIGNTLDRWDIEGLDTNYLSLPRHGWKASLTANFAGITAHVDGRSVPSFGDISVDMASKLNGQTSLSLGYRMLSLDYSFDIVTGYSSDLNLSWLDNAWGIEYRSHSTEGLAGTLDASATDGNLRVSEGDTRLRATLINAYYVLNPERYSLPAAMDQALIQRRSAGSITAYAVLHASDLEVRSADLATMMGGVKKVEFYQTAIGLGYGYNYTPNQGRLLIHLSAAPLLVFFSKNLITADFAIPLPDGSTYHTDISKEVRSKHRLTLTAVARASLFYYLNERIHIGLSGLVNNMGNDTDSGVATSMNDWIVNAALGVRF